MAGYRYMLPREEREEEWVKIMNLENDKKKHNNNLTKQQKAKEQYLSDENVKGFYKELRQPIFKKKYAFDHYESFESELEHYFDLCDNYNQVPSPTSLAVYLGTNTDTIYEHMHNPNSPYSDAIKRTMTYLHAINEGGANSGKIPAVLYIFNSKNFFGMKDDKNITVSAVNHQPINSTETMDAIQKQLAEETVPNADFQEE